VLIDDARDGVKVVPEVELIHDVSYQQALPYQTSPYTTAFIRSQRSNRDEVIDTVRTLLNLERTRARETFE
jgi:hypothetical protein